MDGPERLCQKAIRSASNDAVAPSIVPIVKGDDEDLDACLTQNPVQILERELIHDVPKDPVLETIFRHINSHVLDTRVAAYLKLNYIRLAAIHAIKEADQKEADLILALQTLEVDTTKYTIYMRDGLAHKAQKACRALAQKYGRLRKTLRSSSSSLYATPGFNKNLDSCRSHEFRVLVITHLHLVGGTPSHHQMLKRPKRTSYQQYLTLLPDFLSITRCKQVGRLGFSTKAPTDGPWLFQHAASLEALEIGCWTKLSEESYDALRRHTDQVVFLIHADDQAMPLRIAAKVQSHPREWNTWSAPITCVTTLDGSLKLSPPDFLPGPMTGSVAALLPLTDAPRAATFSLASHTTWKRTGSQTFVEEEQHTKKLKDQA
ncbi:hypothetical protein M436DRAFT_77389 [Aureobasidium namibiae CBS 147.97]|uniref:Uncharacterized protein n=1 Tax=Aureobasidium namibiae CBS 147.97 TaxID=1043004 RepID=A0A074XSF9_9PEZI|nr:uncharacterized protein M436DRAFT_77389 [Aureobasidium namibiae CBS 147.97]KEQ77506.1 hypothetical protein M436DRAFT_77389 [Aureobasidium namibiae CBS 147.97]